MSDDITLASTTPSVLQQRTFNEKFGGKLALELFSECGSFLFLVCKLLSFGETNPPSTLSNIPKPRRHQREIDGLALRHIFVVQARLEEFCVHISSVAVLYT